jgi:transposase
MMGTKARLFTGVPAVTLDELVPADHFYRHLDRVLDLSFVRELVQDRYAGGMGRPSVDPVVFFKLHLVMFFEGIRSERQLLRLAADRLSVRWYLGYNLDESLPEHSSLTRIRARYGLEVFRRFFEAIVAQCQQAGLVWGRELYIDATQVQADAAMDSLTARFAVAAREARKAVETHLASLFADEDAHDTDKIPGHDANDACASASVPAPQAAAPARSPTPLPVAHSDPMRTALATANAARHDWIAQEGRQRREVHGYYQRTADFCISATDPDATPMRLKGGGTRLGYQTHYVVDGGKRRIILQALVTPGEVTENHPMLDLVWRARFRWKLRLRQVTGDARYGTEDNLRALEAMRLRVYIPVSEWEPTRPYFHLDLFAYDATRDVYICPQGHLLRYLHTDNTTGRVAYRAPAAICNTCPVKAQCTPGKHGRLVHRSFCADVVERVRGYQQTPAYEKALRKRQVWVEPLFAEAKEWHGLRRFRLRRLWRVNCEALLTATGQNLKRLLSKRGWGRRPLPSGATLAVPRATTQLADLFVVAWVGVSWCVAPGPRPPRAAMATSRISMAAKQ